MIELELLRSLNDGNLTRANELLVCGADPSVVLNEDGVAGVACMHMAAGLGVDALRLLLAFGGDPNVRSSEGVTPLHIAATWGELDSVKLLLFNGGDPSLKDEDELRPVDVAKQYSHTEVEHFLKYYSLLLIADEETEPKYTRESIESNKDQDISPDILNQSFEEDSCVACSFESPDYSPCRSSVYKHIVNRKLEQCLKGGRDVCFDVTSPSHPCIEYKTPTRRTQGKEHCLYDADATPTNAKHFVDHGQMCSHCGKRFPDRPDFSHHSCSCAYSPPHPGYHQHRLKSYDLYDGCFDSSYTTSDPDCSETPRGDPMRDRLSCFHQWLVYNSGRGGNSAHHHCRRNSKPRVCKDKYAFQDDYLGEMSPPQVRRCPSSVHHHLPSYEVQGRSFSPNRATNKKSHLHLTKLPEKEESSAEKVGRWQSSLAKEENVEFLTRELNTQFKKDQEAQRPKHQVCHGNENLSPDRYFPILSEHYYSGKENAMDFNNSSLDRTLYDPGSLSDVKFQSNDYEPASKVKPNARRSSMYTVNIQRELKRMMDDGKDICFDVTSPGHPVVELKCKKSLQTDFQGAGKVSIPEQKNRLSSISSISASSCDTFVTCDDSEFTLVTPLELTSTGISNKDHLQEFPNQQEKHKKDTAAETRQDSGHNKADTILSPRQTSPVKHARCPSHPHVDCELDISGKNDVPDKQIRNQTFLKEIDDMKQTDIKHFKPSWSWKRPVVDHEVSDLMTSDESFFERNPSPTEAVVRDTSRNVTASSGSKSTHSWLPPQMKEILEETDLMSSDESFLLREQKKRKGNQIAPLVEKLGKISVTEKKSPEKVTSKIPTERKKKVSLDSVYSNLSMKEFLYRDKERGITLLERYVPSDCDEGSTRESLSSSCSTFTINSEDTEIYDWQDYQSETDDERQNTDRITQNSVKAQAENLAYKKTPIPRHLSQLSNEEIRKKLLDCGDNPGPVVPSTRQTYLIRLASLDKDPSMIHNIKLTVDGPEYSPELRAALRGDLDLDGIDDMEDKMVASFQNANGRCWREGTLKSSFNYLLLDPRVTKNLPLRAKSLSESETFKIFIHAIFYVGKGKRARPYCHLYEAISQMRKPKPKVSTKVQHILDIWNEGLGVVSLHCFQSVIPVEAYTREACMVEAFTLAKLTNMKRGDYYGVASTWQMKMKRKMGVYLLKKALQIFLSEGERQICPVDIKGGS